MKKMLLAAIAAPVMLWGADIILTGDSTMAKYNVKRAPLTGWGMELQPLCKDGVKVYNQAISGASSKSYRENFWVKAIAKVKAGDFVFIQFGHNDRSKKADRFSDPETTFQDNLRFFIAEVRAKKATPVLLTITPVCRFNKKGEMYNAKTHQNYIDAIRKVAKEENVALIDHNSLLLKEFGALGAEKAAKMYMNLAPGKYTAYPDGKKDNTHLCSTGAKIAAKAAVENAKSQNLPVAGLFK
jgi:lysophospholipase L1-like esterase